MNDYKVLVDWYCSGNTLTEKEIQILNCEFERIIMKIDTNTYFEKAPPHICNTYLIEGDSFWINCLAALLDQLLPKKEDQTRYNRLLKLLKKYNHQT